MPPYNLAKWAKTIIGGKAAIEKVLIICSGKSSAFHIPRGASLYPAKSEKIKHRCLIFWRTKFCSKQLSSMWRLMATSSEGNRKLLGLNHQAKETNG
jgi:hypothetical protein